MTYQIKLVDRAEREARIKQQVDVSSEYEDFYDFRDQKIQLKAIRIGLDILIYRMENFRTFSEQAEYIARERKSHDFFRSGQENESVQQVQHELLARLAAKGKANSVVPVIDVLQREGQRLRLLITHRGVVVNGNRRLAAMRELYVSDPTAYSQFSHVNCLVLPADTTPNDILEMEGVLQARPETRLDYDWIGDAQLLSALLRMKGTPEAVAKLLGRKASEVKNSLQALAEADLYLKDWAKAEGEYSRVAEAGEQLFKDMPGMLQGKSASLQDASRVIGWTLFENRKKLEGRVYAYNAAIGKRAEDVLDRLSDDLGLSLTTETSTADGEFDFDLGEETGQASYQPLIDILKDDTRKGEAIDSLIDICVSVVESEKDKKSGSAALKAITAAHAKLAEVDLTRASKETYDAIDRQLSSIVSRANDLRIRLEKLRSGAGETKQHSGDAH